MQEVKMKNPKVILIAFLFLSGITAFSLFKYLWSLKEKYDLLGRLNKIKEQTSLLEKDKQNLLQTLEKERQLEQQLTLQNTGLKEELKVSEEKLTQLNQDFIQGQNTIAQLNSEITNLKTESNTLKEERDSLQAQFFQLTEEKESLKARLGSIVELKKAIKEIKKQMRNVGAKIMQKAKEMKAAGLTGPLEGNQGFLIKDGKPTYPAKVKIEVTPAPANQ